MYLLYLRLWSTCCRRSISDPAPRGSCPGVRRIDSSEFHEKLVLCFPTKQSGGMCFQGYFWSLRWSENLGWVLHHHCGCVLNRLFFIFCTHWWYIYIYTFSFSLFYPPFLFELLLLHTRLFPTRGHAHTFELGSPCVARGNGVVVQCHLLDHA